MHVFSKQDAISQNSLFLSHSTLLTNFQGMQCLARFASHLLCWQSAKENATVEGIRCVHSAGSNSQCDSLVSRALSFVGTPEEGMFLDSRPTAPNPPTPQAVHMLALPTPRVILQNLYTELTSPS